MCLHGGGGDGEGSPGQWKGCRKKGRIKQAGKGGKAAEEESGWPMPLVLVPGRWSH